MEAGVASKCAGQLSWSVTTIASKVGRAYVKPLHAQAHKPLPGGLMSPALENAVEWWMAYLDTAPRFFRRFDMWALAKHIVAWSDASGEGRWLCAMIRLVDGEYLWTRMKVEDELYNQFLWRQDNQIQAQEMLSTILIFSTFVRELKGNSVTAFADNNSILHCLTKGRASFQSPDLNALVGRTWLHIAKHQIFPHLCRVESKANPTDGPARKDCSLSRKLKARYVQPSLPYLALHVWQPLRPNSDDKEFFHPQSD